MKGKDEQGFVFLPKYGVAVRPDGAVKTKMKGVYFGSVRDKGNHLAVGTAMGTQFVHRLIAEAFIGESSEYVNHKNGIAEDNRLANLEYCSHRYNVIHSLANSNQRGYYVTKQGRYAARIRIHGKTKLIGVFETAEEANAAYTEEQNRVWAELQEAR